MLGHKPPTSSQRLSAWYLHCLSDGLHSICLSRVDGVNDWSAFTHSRLYLLSLVCKDQILTLGLLALVQTVQTAEQTNKDHDQALQGEDKLYLRI